MIAIVPTAIVVIALKVLSYDRFRHFVVAGFATGVGCTLFFTMTGYSALLHDFGGWLERASSYWFLLPIGALAGAFVWMVGEWNPHWLSDE